MANSWAVIATYEYDATGRRIAKTTSAGTTNFYWIGLQLAMEYDGSGLLSRRHLGAGFGEVASAYQRDIADLDGDASTTDYVSIQPLYDGAYDCVGVLDHTGVLAESYVHAYDGAVTITNGAGQPLTSSAVGWHQGYGRMYRDAESGLLYSVYRHYNPATGRFVTEDPLGAWFDAPNLGNGYAWVANRYLNGWDPLGLGDPGKGDNPIFRMTKKAAEEALKDLKKCNRHYKSTQRYKDLIRRLKSLRARNIQKPRGGACRGRGCNWWGRFGGALLMVLTLQSDAWAGEPTLTPEEIEEQLEEQAWAEYYEVYGEPGRPGGPPLFHDPAEPPPPLRDEGPPPPPLRDDGPRPGFTFTLDNR